MLPRFLSRFWEILQWNPFDFVWFNISHSYLTTAPNHFLSMNTSLHLLRHYISWEHNFGNAAKMVVLYLVQLHCSCIWTCGVTTNVKENWLTVWKYFASWRLWAKLVILKYRFSEQLSLFKIRMFQIYKTKPHKAA